MKEFVILGLGADPRMYGSSQVSSPEIEEAAMQYILTYPGQSSDLDPILFVVELLFEGGLEILFGLIELL